MRDEANERVEEIIKLYFKGYSVKEAIEITRERNMKKEPSAKGSKVKTN